MRVRENFKIWKMKEGEEEWERKSGRDGELKGERENLREKDREYENPMCK